MPGDSLEKTNYEIEEESTSNIDVKQRILRGSFLPVMLLLQRGQLAVDQIWDPTIGTQLIHFVAHFGKVKPLRALVEIFNADVNARDYRRLTPLHSAALGGEIATLAYLACCDGIDLDAADNAGLTPLLYTVSHNHVACFAYLAFEKRADLNARDINGCGVLHWAVYSGSMEILQLLQHTPLIKDINMKDNIQQTPIFKALYRDHREVIKFMLRHKCDLSVRDHRGTTPRELVLRYMQNEKLSELLEKYQHRDFFENALSCREITLHFKCKTLFLHELLNWLYNSYLSCTSKVIYFVFLGSLLFAHWNYKSEEARADNRAGETDYSFSTTFFHLQFVLLSIAFVCAWKSEA